eukprot:1860209-Rhodomonas_salina.3
MCDIVRERSRNLRQASRTASPARDPRAADRGRICQRALGTRLRHHRGQTLGVSDLTAPDAP